MSTNLEYRTRERPRKRESRRQGCEAQRKKGDQSCRVRDKKTKKTFVFPLEEQHGNFVAEVTK